MLKKLAIGLLALVLAAPLLSMVGIGLLMNPALSGACTVSGRSFTVGEVPDELAVRDPRRRTVHAEQDAAHPRGHDHRDRLRHRRREPRWAPDRADGSPDRIDAASARQHERLPGVRRLPERRRRLRQRLVGAVPDAPAVRVGHRRRPHGHHLPGRGVLRRPRRTQRWLAARTVGHPGWEDMGKGEAAQAVEVSAHPERYENYSPVAIAILDALIGPTTAATATVQDGSPGDRPGAGGVLASGVPAAGGHLDSDLAIRVPDPPDRRGTEAAHRGGLPAADGTPILAAADGMSGGFFTAGRRPGRHRTHHRRGHGGRAYAHSWRTAST